MCVAFDFGGVDLTGASVRRNHGGANGRALTNADAGNVSQR
jgi:hypothetical protein